MLKYLVNGNLNGHVEESYDSHEYESIVGDGWGSGFNRPNCYDFGPGGPYLEEGEESGFGGGFMDDERYEDEGGGYGNAFGYGEPDGGMDGMMQSIIRDCMGERTYG